MFDLFGRRQTRNPVLQGEFSTRLYDELSRSAQLASQHPANSTGDAVAIALSHALAGFGDSWERRDREKFYTRQQDAEKRHLGALSETLMGLTGGAATSPAMASPAALGDALMASPSAGPSAPSAAPRGAVGVSYEPGSPVLPSQPPRSYAEAVGMSESGGQMIPNGTGSSAFGTYQFLPSTWQGLAERYPDQLRPDGISDPAQQEIAMQLFTDENRAALRRSLGREPTDAELYAAHALGAGGASTFLQAYAANPDTPMADVVAQIAGPNADAWMAQNPQFGNGQTVGGMMHMYERPFAGSTGHTDPGVGPVAAPSTMPAQAPAPSGGRPPMDPRLQALIPMLIANRQEDTAIALVSEYLMQDSGQFRVLSPQEEIQMFGQDLEGSYQIGPDNRVYPISNSGTTVNVNTGDTTPRGIDVSGSVSDTWTAAFNAGPEAQSLLASLDTMEALYPNAITGAGAQTLTDLSNIALQLGFTDIDVAAVGASQAMTAIMNRLALAVRAPDGPFGGMPGATSNRDITFLLDSIPGLQQTPQGFQLALMGMRMALQRQADLSNLAARYYDGTTGTINPAFLTEYHRLANSDILTPEMRQQIEALSGGGAASESPDAPAFESLPPDGGSYTPGDVIAIQGGHAAWLGGHWVRARQNEQGVWEVAE